MPNDQPRLLSKLLSIFFDLLYNKFSWTYNFVSWAVSLGMWNNWIKSVIPNLIGPKILEVGHGPGHLQKELARNHLEIYGLDLSPKMGIICAKRLQKEKLPYNLVNGKTQKLPFAANSFHQVVATFPTEYIIASETITEVYRILLPGGKLVIAPVAWITGKSILHKLAAWLFKVTGQSGDFDNGFYLNELVEFENIGFNTETTFIDFPNSRVLHVIATKPEIL